MENNHKFSWFVGRQNVVDLFKCLYVRNPKDLQPLLPILLLLAPPGGGITSLIELLAERCNSALPYAYLDFAQSDAPVSMPEFLHLLVDQLSRSGNIHTKKLTFPRSELGFSVILDTADNANPFHLREEMKGKALKNLSIHEQFDDLINATSNWLMPVALFLVLCKWLFKMLGERIPPLRELIWGPQVKWYMQQCQLLKLPANADIIDVLVRIYQWNRPSEPLERRLAVERLLYNAFLADLGVNFDMRGSRSARERTTNAVFFIDNLDLSPNELGSKFLGMLIKSRMQGNTDPLLVVVGSHKRLFDLADPLQNIPFTQQEGDSEQQDVEEFAYSAHVQWERRILSTKPPQESQFCLPLWLSGLGKSDISAFLLKSVGRGELPTPQYLALIEQIQHVTYGHPLALRLVVDSLQDAQKYKRAINIQSIMQEYIPSNALPYVAYDENKTTIGVYLLSVFLRQFSEAEQEQISDCSVPRILDFSTLKALLPSPENSREAYLLWERYSRHTFTLVSGDQTLTFHPLLRDLLKQRLVARSQSGRDYYKVIHSNLRDYFAEYPPMDNSQAQVDEAYHALALGDSEPAIAYISSAIVTGDENWSAALDIITHAPAERQPANTRLRATQALFNAKLHQRLQDAVTSLVLYTWLLHTSDLGLSDHINLWYDLSETYRYLPMQDQQKKWKISADYSEKARVLAIDQTPALSDLRPAISTPLAPFPVRAVSKLWHRLRVAVAVLFVISTISSYLFTYYNLYSNTVCNPNDIFSLVPVIQSVYFSQGVRITHAGDGECIGLSDGNFAFDVRSNIAAGAAKEQAALALTHNNIADANNYWDQATQSDSSDAESLIYKENQRVLDLASSEKLPYVTVVVMAELTAHAEDHNSVANGRSSLQGAYIAQIQHNKDFRTPLLRILVANCGGMYAYAEQVAHQIIQARQNDSTIVGIMGPSQSWDTTIAAIKILGQAHIPMISDTASSDALTNISPYFFRVSPSNKYQVQIAVKYAEDHFNAKTAVVFEALKDNYSKSLTNDFINQFVTHDHHQIVKLAKYNAADSNASNIISDETNNACSYSPDFIYFTGRSDAMRFLLDDLDNTPCSKGDMKIIGGDTLDQLTSSLGVDYPYYAYNHLYYTSFAFPSEWSLRGFGQYQPAFFNDYPRYFDPKGQYKDAPKYGFTLPNGHVTLAYDAMTTMLYAIIEAVRITNKVTFKLEALRSALSHIHGSSVVQGASGIIDFGADPDGDPVNKVVVMVQIAAHGDARLVYLAGLLFKHTP